MAYMSPARTKEIRELLKKEFPNLKLSVTNRHYSTVVVSIMAGDIDFAQCINEDRLTCQENIDYAKKCTKEGIYQLNEHNIKEEWTGIALKTLLRIKEIAGAGCVNRNAGDSTADYCDYNFYYDIQIGKWDKPYELREVKIEKESVKKEVKEAVKELVKKDILVEIKEALESDFTEIEKLNFIQTKIAEYKRSGLKIAI